MTGDRLQRAHEKACGIANAIDNALISTRKGQDISARDDLETALRTAQDLIVMLRTMIELED